MSESSPQQPQIKTKPATISDVARLAGVSPGAVSKVFNNSGRISLATADRIRDAARKLNWKPNSTAVALRTSRSHTIGVVLSSKTGRPDLSNSHVDFLTGIELALHPRNYGLLLNINTQNKGDEVGFYQAMIAQQRMDGLIITDPKVYDPRIDFLKGLGIPLVVAGTPHESYDVPFADVSPSGSGVDQAVDHLVSLGHTRISYIGGSTDYMLPKIRQEAFVSALATHGLYPHSVSSMDYSYENGHNQTLELLGKPNPPSAIMYGNDPMAIAGIHAAESLNFRIPTDLSIVGFDGLALGDWVRPRLTTVQRNSEQRGTAVATKLLHLIDGKLEPEFLIDVPRLIVRESTGPCSHSK